MSFHPSNSPGSPDGTPALERALVSAFLETVPDLVYFKDRDSRFIAVSRSKARRHHLEPAAMVGRSDHDFFSEQHAQWARVDEENIMSTGESIIGKLDRVAWPDGRQTWAQSSKLPLHDETGAVVGTFGLTTDVTKEQEMQLELEVAQRKLIDASRTAGMAEVATGVLHNVGNVLTSLNVSANVIATQLHQSKMESLGRLAALLHDHAHDLGEFVAHDPKGRRVPDFLESLARHATEERDLLLRELASLQQNIDHIKEIVTMQQAYATTIGVVETLDASLLVEDAIRMNAGAFVRHDISVVREFHPAPSVTAEKGKVLQILVNLLRNAKYACDEGRSAGKIITLRIEPAGSSVRLTVQDNGIGIAAEHLPASSSTGSPPAPTVTASACIPPSPPRRIFMAPSPWRAPAAAAGPRSRCRCRWLPPAPLPPIFRFPPPVDRRKGQLPFPPCRSAGFPPLPCPAFARQHERHFKR